MRFIYNSPALYHKGALIIGDIHFGIENKLKEKGIYTEGFSEIIVKKIIALLKTTKAKKLIILGDAKENITHIDYKTKKIFDKLQKITELIIVKGNHDGNIEQICKNVKPVSGFIYHGLALIHGNAWPADELMNCEYILSAHQHPMVQLTDKLNKKHFEPAWLVIENNIDKIKKYYKNFNSKIKLILMPAFNPIAGKSINLDAGEQLGPLLHNKLFKLNDAIVYTINGNYLGELKKLV